MAAQDDNAAFLGCGWSFPPLFDAFGGTVKMVQGDTDIQQSLTILCSTLLGERVMLPQFGAGLGQFVFDRADATLIARIKSTLSNAVLLYEPRIDLDDITVVESGTIDGLLEIGMTYTIRQTNSRSNMVYPFYLQGEGTNVRRGA
ncbi:MAG TPA: GPW/gp25 family protein [Telluria sp.]|nr:GPW/gp25 family protein [Telluria sp.]